MAGLFDWYPSRDGQTGGKLIYVKMDRVTFYISK
jgi:hypothetical protein